MRRLSPHLTAALVSLLLFGLGQALARPTADPAAPAALPAAFTYQGHLMDGDRPAEGRYDLTFRLYDAPAGGAQIGGAVARQGVVVQRGVFSVLLDFGAGAYAGPRYLEVQVGGATLSPRQPLTPAPAALYAAAAPWGGLSGVPAGLADGDDDTTYTAGPGLALSGTELRAQGSPYAGVVAVAKGGGDFASVQAAIDSIADAGPGNPYLIYVAPGVYSERVTLKPYVTLEGAGEGATIIRWNGGGQLPIDGSGSATLIGASNSALRHLTVESGGAGQNCGLAIYIRSSSAMTVTNVTAVAAGATNNYGVHNESASPVMTNVTASASGGTYSYGVYSFSAEPAMTNVAATGSGGVNGYGVYNDYTDATMVNVTATGLGSTGSFGVWNSQYSSPTIRGSTLTGGTNSVYSSYSTVRIAATQLNGPLSPGLICTGVYNANFAPITCP